MMHMKDWHNEGQDGNDNMPDAWGPPQHMHPDADMMM
jgi:hypothetical protein